MMYYKKKIKKVLIGVVLGGILLISFKGTVSSKIEFNYDSKIDSLIALMTLEEKVGMIHGISSFTSGGVERLGIPPLVMSDGPHGVRREFGHDWVPDKNVDDSGTYLPTCITLSATWNKDLAYEFGKVLGSEARYRGKDIILGPGVNIIRTPLNGRNFEYLSEDPYLNASMAVNYIKGVQDQDVAACVKHFIANNQETERGRVSVEMEERTLQEIYLPTFKASVGEAGVHAIMGSYNKLRNQYCTHNEYLVNNILKTEYDFQGILISDWGAVHNTMEALYNGTDIEMGTDLKSKPNPDFRKFYMADTVMSMVKRGQVPESLIDEKVRRILKVMFTIGMFSEDRYQGAYNTSEHQQVALRVAEEGIVLLKNEDLLPITLKNKMTIAVIGENAIRKHALGGGSSEIKAKYEITPLEGIQNLVGNTAEIKYAQGYVVTKENMVVTELVEEAVKLASGSDIVIYTGGWIHDNNKKKDERIAFDSEGRDKPNLTMPFGQNELIKVICKANPNTVVVLFGGGPVDMSEWVDHCKAIIQAWYPGMEGGTALANILFGKTNPSGKLPMTFSNKAEDYPSHKLGEYPGENQIVHYKEGIYVGYRYFDTYHVQPQFCFGHGLSYTEFSYSDLLCDVTDDKIKVIVTIRNKGRMDGAEVVQLYVSDKTYTKAGRALKELKAFEKIYIRPRKSETIEIILDKSAFSYFNEEAGKWTIKPGLYDILVGSSSRDIRQSCQIEIK